MGYWVLCLSTENIISIASNMRSKDRVPDIKESNCLGPN